MVNKTLIRLELLFIKIQHFSSEKWEPQRGRIYNILQVTFIQYTQSIPTNKLGKDRKTNSKEWVIDLNMHFTKKYVKMADKFLKVSLI